MVTAIADRRIAATAPRRLFRLVVRDTAPDDARLYSVIRQVEHPGPLATGLGTRRYQFDSDRLWPTATDQAGSSGAEPWTFLLDGRIPRGDLVWFCENFVIEVNAPAASFDLTMPDADEHVILRRMFGDIGAEAYPNEHRTAVDLAAAFISVARAARAGVTAPAAAMCFPLASRARFARYFTRHGGMAGQRWGADRGRPQ